MTQCQAKDDVGDEERSHRNFKALTEKSEVEGEGAKLKFSKAWGWLMEKR